MAPIFRAWNPLPGFRSRRRLLRALVALAATALGSCSENQLAPVNRDLRVSVITSGDDIDLDGYVVAVDNSAFKSVGANEQITIPKLAPGRHTVSLDGVAPNCVVVGSPTQFVNLESSDEPVIYFSLYCAMTGVLVTINESGDDFDLDGYDLNLGDVRSRVFAGQPLGFGRLSPGVHTVGLESLAPNCAVLGENPRTVNVINRNLTAVDFVVNCKSTTGSIEIRVATSGVDQDFDGYKARIDDAKEQTIVTNGGAIVFQKLSPGDHAVRLDSVATNCVVADNALRTAHVSAAEITQISFQVNCTKAELIAFTRFVDGYARAYVMLEDGTSMRRVGTGFDPSWSANGARLVLRYEDCYYYYYYCSFGLNVLDSDGQNTKQLTTSDDRQPDWSPDGSTIAFARFVDEHSGLYVMKADGTGVTAVAIAQFTGDVEDPAWSPDGSKLAFTCGQTNIRDICVVNADGSGLRRLTSDIAVDMAPVWSPDGSRIAFATNRFTSSGGTISVAVMRADGSDLQQLAPGQDPAWSRDGSRIVFVGAGTPGLFSINPDGTGVRRLTTNPTDRAPDWRP
jgi:Tol biopolymer transport system component